MNYFLKRILYFIPTLLIISLIVFFISQMSSNDPLLQLEDQNDRAIKSDYLSLEKRSRSIRMASGSDKVSFYFSIGRITLDKEIQNIYIQTVRNNVSAWSFGLGSWQNAFAIYQKLNREIINSSDPNHEATITALLFQEDVDMVIEGLKRLDLEEFNKAFFEKLNDRPIWKNYVPTIHWNGTDNQYHHWISSIIHLDLGRSVVSKEAVGQKVGHSLVWTLGLSLTALLLALIIAVPLAVLAAQDPGGTLDKICNNLFFAFYSMPVFWVASLLLIYFASVEHFYWFPSFGVGEVDQNMSLGEIIAVRIPHLILPLICWTYASLAFIYRQMRSKLMETLTKDYILTARAKGLSSNTIMWKHAFKNSSFPLITLLGASLPALITGSFVIESIFSIPGMGKLTIDAYLQRDFPLIYIITLLACFLTVLGIFLADLAYHYSDPRIRYSNSNE